MAKASRTTEESTLETSPAVETPNPTPASETVMGYFRRIYTENPKLLKMRSNEEVFQRWLQDHPEYSVVPDKIKNGLANLKSLLRKDQKKKKGKGKSKSAVPGGADTPASNGMPTAHISVSKLEGLEQQIDDCIVLAKTINREGLEHVIRSLRRARNEIVMRLDH